MTENALNNSLCLLEIGTEDLPARFIPPAMKQLRENAEKIFRENYVPFAGIRTYGTPRRLAVIVDGIPQMQEDRVKEVFGPSKKAAFDIQGNPTKAARGFAASQGVSVERLVIMQKDKGEYVVAVIAEKGVHVTEVLPDILKKLLFSLHLPKSMRWGDRTIRFARPIRWLLALFGNTVIRFEVDGIQSDMVTKGHRFLSPEAFQIKEISEYKNLLANHSVIVDSQERKKLIIERTAKLLEPLGEKVMPDEELLDTVVNLVEYPVPVIAQFSEEYLALPSELLITVMKGHQKYFAVENKAGELTNHFIVISNTSGENADTVRIGAERVIRARFEDARFYYEEDTKKPLVERLEELKKVTFQESLGSVYKKTERIVSNAGFLAGRIVPSGKENVIRAAQLVKTDLVTGVVREFPELQGVMGRYYALHDREEEVVAQAIQEHYLPTHSGGKLPETDTGTILSLADKIDTIAAFFSIGLVPTGSEDPFALRRAALGIITILFGKGYDLTIRELAEQALSNLQEAGNMQETENAMLKFFEGRIETVLLDQGYSPDLVSSILPLSMVLRLQEVRHRLDALREFKKKEEYNDFLAAVKRVNNIKPKQALPEVTYQLLKEEQEKQLKEKLDSIKPALVKHVKNNTFQDALMLLSSLTEPINQFFDHVLVMDKSEEIKQNRLSLLFEVWQTVSHIADFSKLQTS
ncbi:MAG: glycine--tRNA ligase subunit beta [Thermodesulfovibrionales bacterium]|nr:glycine--tRNA ligase subunit beta [Thermodesulfovibrionales bacterium]